MGTDERTEVTEERPSAGEQVADSNMRQVKEPRQKKERELRISLHAEYQMMTNEEPTFWRRMATEQIEWIISYGLT